MADSIFPTLSPTIRKQLLVCGITTDAQLAGRTASDICQELQTAADFFPEEHFTLTEEEISELIERAQHVLGERGVPKAQPARKAEAFKIVPAVELPPLPASPLPEPEEEEPISEAEKNAFREHLKSASSDKRGSKAITCGKPFSLYFGAISTLLVPFFLASLVGIPILLLLTDFRPLSDNQLYYILFACALILPYLIMVRLVHCSVCHMNIFTFRRYPYHSKAHRFPLLGVPFATALRIALTLHFTCPACGTTQKLIGRRHHHRSHRK